MYIKLSLKQHLVATSTLKSVLCVLRLFVNCFDDSCRSCTSIHFQLILRVYSNVLLLHYCLRESCWWCLAFINMLNPIHSVCVIPKEVRNLSFSGWLLSLSLWSDIRLLLLFCHKSGNWCFVLFELFAILSCRYRL